MASDGKLLRFAEIEWMAESQRDWKSGTSIVRRWSWLNAPDSSNLPFHQLRNWLKVVSIQSTIIWSIIELSTNYNNSKLCTGRQTQKIWTLISREFEILDITSDANLPTRQKWSLASIRHIDRSINSYINLPNVNLF